MMQERFFNRELMDFFESRGVELTVERGNRVYPASGKALDIFLALINDLEGRPNVTIRKNVTVKSIKVENGKWKVESDASASKEFSTFHLMGLLLASRSTAVSVIAWVEPLSKVAMRSALFIPNVVPNNVL